MSKSKGNTVDPDEVFKTYGADTARLFILSDSPPENDFDWKDAGVEGCYKFLRRIWRLIVENQACIDLTLPQPAYETLTGPERLLYQHIQQALHGVTMDIQKEFQFNTVVSKIREYVNHLSKYPLAIAKPDSTWSYGVGILLILLTPITPHIAQALWHKLGQSGNVMDQPWPQINPQALVSDRVEIVFQVNGKVRDKAQVAVNLPQADLEQQALASPKVQAFLANQTPIKVIVIPNKLVNFVIPQ